MSIEISFKGKKVIVTGAGRGSGRALSEKLHEQGAIVYAISRNQANLDSLKAVCPNVVTHAVDLEDWDATRATIESIGVVDAVINNAAILELSPILETTRESFLRLFNVNTSAVLNVSQASAKLMIAAGRKGSIVNISALASQAGFSGLSPYAVSKAALDRLTEAMAYEFGSYGIRVNAVNPTAFETDMNRELLRSGGGDELLKRTPSGRYAEMDEIVNTVLFLLSDLAPIINGQKLFIDGGYRLT